MIFVVILSSVVVCNICVIFVEYGIYVMLLIVLVEVLVCVEGNVLIVLFFGFLFFYKCIDWIF